MINFDILSDTHIEYLNALSIGKLLCKISQHKKSNIICLLGDIGYPYQDTYRYFLQQLLDIYRYVIVLSGNHELYNSDTDAYSIQLHIRTICQQLNEKSKNTIMYLQKNSIEIDGYIFLGCTLWTNVSPQTAKIVQPLINDYKKIHTSTYRNHKCVRTKKITAKTTNKWHTNHVNWIREQLNKIKDTWKKIIILTHHAPVIDVTIHPEQCQNNTQLSEIYCTDLSDLLVDPIICWCFGHTHQEYKKYHGNVLVQSNPVGYKLDKINSLGRYFTVKLINNTCISGVCPRIEIVL